MALITTPEQLRACLPAPYGNALKSLPDFTLAEEQQLIPFIGEDLYQQLLGNNLSSLLLALKELCCKVVAPFAYVTQLDFLQVQLSDNGLIAFEPQNARKAYKWENNAIKDALNNMGYARQESLLRFLSKNATSLPAWSSAPYNQPSFAFIRNGMDLAEAVYLVQPHRSYMSLMPILDEVGEMTVQDTLGAAYYADLSTRLLAGQTTQEEAPIIRLIRKAAGRLAIAKATRVLNVTYTPAVGFTILDAAVKDNTQEGRKAASADQINTMAEEQNLTSMAMLEKVKATLDAIASETVVPVYFHSPAYSNPHIEPGKLRSDRTGMFCI